MRDRPVFERVFLSRVGFLMSGWTVQDLKLSGKRPVARDRFIMLVIVGISIGHFLRRDVGIGSRSQVELFEEEINFDISSVVAGVNWHKTGGVEEGKEKRSHLEEFSSSLRRSEVILSEKKEENWLHRSAVLSDEGRTGSERRSSKLLIVFQSFLESDLDEEIKDL